MKQFAERRHKAEEYIEQAIKCLNAKDKQEKQMINDLKDIKRRIDDTIIYYISSKDCFHPCCPFRNEDDKCEIDLFGDKDNCPYRESNPS